ncbi:MAG: hypothetical protein ACE5G0_07275 [Rhodothermales bacterium]
MASSNSPAEGAILWERLREWFSRSRGEALLGDDTPRHRGFAVSMCVLLSIVLWFTLSIRETYVDLIELPTQIVNLPEDQALTRLPPSTVQVQVRGEGTKLFGLHFDPPVVVIDAVQPEVDFATLVNLPQGVSSESVIPRSFSLQTEPSISRKIPITLRASIETAATHALFDEPTLFPDSVVVTGAQSIIGVLKYWPTQDFEQQGLQDSLVVVVPLADTLAGLVTTDVKETTMTAVAQQFTEDRRWLQVQVTGGATERLVTLDPPTVVVTYRVPLSQYDQAKTAPDFFATVSYDAIRNDATGRVRPELNLPGCCILHHVVVEPSTLQYYERLVGQ